jgi:hypothetical protein
MFVAGCPNPFAALSLDLASFVVEKNQSRAVLQWSGHFVLYFVLYSINSRSSRQE